MTTFHAGFIAENWNLAILGVTTVRIKFVPYSKLTSLKLKMGSLYLEQNPVQARIKFNKSFK